MGYLFSVAIGLTALDIYLSLLARHLLWCDLRFHRVNHQQKLIYDSHHCIFYLPRLFVYHAMTEDAAAARKTIAASIEKLKTVHQAKPASYNLQVFFNAKYNELVEIYKPAEPAEKSKLFNTLQILDPGHISQYQLMMRGS